MPRSGVFRKTPAGYTAFFPSNLPPEPPINIEGDLQLLLSDADRALGALNVVVTVLPNPDLFVGMFIQKEALLSSQIEGTQSSLVDVLGVDEDHAPTEEVGEVINYVQAMRHGLKRLKEDDFPMSLRLIREIHEVLMQQVRGGGSHLTPGEFRTMQNWIGGTNPGNARFVPPPPDVMQDALSAFEQFLHQEDDLPPLIRCALVHYQFETIHPFNDGNGRVGRLLITLYLVWKGILDEPMLYLSAYLKLHQQEYYDRLTQVRNDGNFEPWTRFFLEGVCEVSRMVLETTKRIQALERADSDRLVAEGEGSHGINLLRGLMLQPVVTANDIAKIVGVSYTKANTLIGTCERLGILRQISKGKRNRRFMYFSYVDILAEGTELKPSEE
ncbi:MAG: Fic family protein [Desulfuromonadales bacterium]|nr:Fic family protein [Desulfuromonadales bacterium]